MTNIILAAHMVISAAHLSALSQIESGDDDFAVGACGEVSRWQVRHDIWQTQTPGISPRNYEAAKKVVTRLWQARVDRFEKIQQRTPTLVELALLYHRPHKVFNPSLSELDYAERFQNLFFIKQAGSDDR